MQPNYRIHPISKRAISFFSAILHILPRSRAVSGQCYSSFHASDSRTNDVSRPPRMPLFLGVDGGQSSTTALVGDEAGRVRGCGTGGPCNHVGAAEGREKLARAVSESVAAACQQAQLDPRQIRFEAACFGMSGGPADKEAILARILPARKLIVTHDALIALSGATAGEPGV